MSETRRNQTGRTGSSRQNNADRILAVQNARNLGSGNQRRSPQGNRRRKRRRQGPDLAKLLLILIGVVIAVLCISVGLRACSKGNDKEVSQTEEVTTEPETEIQAEITVNGVSVHGMTKSEAEKKVLDAIGWDMKASYNGESKAIDNLMTSNVDEILTKAFEKGESASYTVSADRLEEAAAAAAASLADGWDVKPKNGSISSFDKSSGKFTFSAGEVGVEIDREKLASDIVAAAKAGEYKKTIEVSGKEVQPEITEAQARENFKRLGTYTTTTTTNKDRNENIRIAADALNGIIVQPGGEFSFNLTTGNRTTDKGYRPAGAYQNGVLVEEPGGGVCQVSSTLYNAVVFAGLKTTERHAHSYEPSYVTPGEDAMVSYDGHSGPDMRFVNNSKTAVGIKTSFSDRKLTVSIYGNPILEEGITLSMKSEKVKELDPPAPTYTEDPTLQPGVEVEAKAAVPGSRWVTNLVTKKNGTVISDEFFHNSTYNGKPATIKRNTSGSVAAPEGESSSESASAGESTAATDTQTTETTPDTAHPTTPAASQMTGSENQGPGYETEAPNGPGEQSGPASNGSASPEPGNGNGAQSPAVSEGPSDMGFITPIN